MCENFCIPVQGVFQAPKTAKVGNFEWVLVVKLLLKWHSFMRWESFRGLVNIPSMCNLCMRFGGGCTIWALWAPEKPQYQLLVPSCSCTPFTFWRLSRGGSTPPSSQYCSESPDPLQPFQFVFAFL